MVNPKILALQYKQRLERGSVKHFGTTGAKQQRNDL